INRRPATTSVAAVSKLTRNAAAAAHCRALTVAVAMAVARCDGRVHAGVIRRRRNTAVQTAVERRRGG
ncbi:MAG: hypothetical protein ACK559_01790, partial [bacterium]